MITVESRESPATAQDVEALLSELDARPGLWMGCDVASEGLFRKTSIACAVPAVRFSLDGTTLSATALTPVGGGLLAAFGNAGGSYRSGMAVLAELRRFLAMFDKRAPELGFYGAFSFDYFLLRSDSLPDDGRRRFVLYFPERVLVAGETGARWIDLRFAGVAPGPVAEVEAVHIHAGVEEPPAGRHAERVAQGIEKLKRGELYSLVLSQTFRRRTRIAPARAFAGLRARNPYPAMFFCNLGGGEILFGASPDLQVRANAVQVESAPVCGTLRRGADPVEDAAQAFALLESAKEGAAIALCADSAASEHAAVCEPGSVEVVSYRRPHFFSTIIHAIDHLRGRRRAGLDGFDILLAHAAPATVTGLPKRDAVRAIADLEEDWRGWYAGAVARIGSDGSVEAYTVLRAARIAAGVAEIRTGGNILVDSDPQNEEEESRLKAQTLFRVLEGNLPAPEPTQSHARWRIRVLDADDPFGAGLRNALAGAGALESDAGILVLSAAPRSTPLPDTPLLAIGAGALWLLERDGAPAQRLPMPEFARTVAGRTTGAGFLAGLGSFEAGWYATSAIRTGTLPADWIECAVSEEGWVLAAQHPERQACALLFRPDSVLSLRAGCGRYALGAALRWLSHGMLAEKSRREGP